MFSSAVDLWNIAAEKYFMPGIAQVLLLAIRGRLTKESNPRTRYIYAELCGFDDLASIAMGSCCKQTLSIRLGDLLEAHVRHALAIRIERDRRIRHFFCWAFMYEVAHGEGSSFLLMATVHEGKVESNIPHPQMLETDSGSSRWTLRRRIRAYRLSLQPSKATSCKRSCRK